MPPRGLMRARRNLGAIDSTLRRGERPRIMVPTDARCEQELLGWSLSLKPLIVHASPQDHRRVSRIQSRPARCGAMLACTRSPAWRRSRDRSQSPRLASMLLLDASPPAGSERERPSRSNSRRRLAPGRERAPGLSCIKPRLEDQYSPVTVGRYGGSQLPCGEP